MFAKLLSASLAIAVASVSVFAADAKITASASSVQDNDESLKAANAVDGDASTRWSSAWNDSEWICLALPAPREIGGAKLTWETAFAKEYVIQVSDDAKTWKDVYVQRDGQGSTEEFFFPSPVKAKYVRLLGVKRATEFGYSLYEFVLLDAVTPDAEKKVSASSVQTPELKPENAVDGDSTTRWGSKFSDNEWLCVNLGSEKTVVSAELSWEGAYAKEYKIQGSLDGKAWTDLYEQKDGKGGQESVTFAKPAKAKYVRMLGLKRGSPYGYSLYEFTINAK